MYPVFVSDDVFLKNQNVIIDDLLESLCFFVETVSDFKDDLCSFGVWNYGFCFKRSLEINHEVYRSMWSGDISDRHMLILTLEDKTDGVSEEEDSDYYLFGKNAKGFGLAVENDQFLVRRGGALDKVEVVEGDKLSLSEEGELVERKVCCHTVGAGNSQVSSSVRKVFLDKVRGGEDVWNLRRTLFPRLRFLSHVQDYLDGLQIDQIRGVKEELWYIDWLVGKWRQNGGGIPSAGGRITREFEERRRSSYFWDEYRCEKSCFDYHARYTPSEGRIHFKFEDVEEKNAVIAYIGSKR